MQPDFETSQGRVRVASIAELREDAAWQRSFASAAKDSRFYEVAAETLRADFDFHALVLETRDGERVFQPTFFVDQDILATAPAPLRAVAEAVRKVMPRFLRLRLLMVGNAAGEGSFASADAESRRALLAAAAEVLPQVARGRGAWMIVWKDWPAATRGDFATLVRGGFTRLASMPATELRLAFSDFDDYLRQRVSHSSRKDLRRKFRAIADVPLTMEVVGDVASVVDEVHALYSQVLARSPLQFERLTKDFLLQLSARMRDRARFFLWRSEGRLVACSICLVHGDTISDEYLGLDYAVALEWHLYFITIRDVLSWAMANGLRLYRSTPLNYEPKLRLGFDLAPLDLYVAAPWRWLNAIVQRVLPWIEPTRSEPLLREFPNASEL